mmetsp:Transcript_27489/g.50817  ORF Transcript_27489/g.50817 Transcript_27489/m.50817 type:complete len:301 (-) Transcript_27489:235-1137(-)
MGHANHDDFATTAQITRSLFIGRDGAHGHDNRLSPLASQRLVAAAPGALAGGQHPVGRAKGFGVFQFLLGHIDGHNAAGTGDARALNGVQTHTTRANDHHVLARPEACRVYHSADARDHAAGNQAGGILGDTIWDLDQLFLVHHHLFGKGPAGHRLMQLGVLSGADRPLVPIVGGFTPGGLAPCACGARAAGPDQGDHNAITDIRPRHTGTHSADNTSRLMAVNRRQAAAPGPLGIGNVGMTYRNRIQGHFDLAHLGRAQQDIFDHEGRAEFMAHGGFDGLHVCPLLRPFGQGGLVLSFA